MLRYGVCEGTGLDAESIWPLFAHSEDRGLDLCLCGLSSQPPPESKVVLFGLFWGFSGLVFLDHASLDSHCVDQPDYHAIDDSIEQSQDQQCGGNP